MSAQNHNTATQSCQAELDAQVLAAASTSDAGKVRLGGLGPVFKDVADKGKVRLGGLSPLFR